METISSNMMGMTLGLDMVMHGELKIVVCKKAVNGMPNAFKYVMAGAFVSDQNIKEIDGHWHSLEGTGILIPSRLHSKMDSKHMEGGRIGQLLTSGYHINSSQWGKHIEFNK